MNTLRGKGALDKPIANAALRAFITDPKPQGLGLKRVEREHIKDRPNEQKESVRAALVAAIAGHLC